MLLRDWQVTYRLIETEHALADPYHVMMRDNAKGVMVSRGLLSIFSAAMLMTAISFAVSVVGPVLTEMEHSGGLLALSERLGATGAWVALGHAALALLLMPWGVFSLPFLRPGVGGAQILVLATQDEARVWSESLERRSAKPDPSYLATERERRQRLSELVRLPKASLWLLLAGVTLFVFERPSILDQSGVEALMTDNAIIHEVLLSTLTLASALSLLWLAFAQHGLLKSARQLLRSRRQEARDIAQDINQFEAQHLNDTVLSERR